ncbi:MAG: (Fe-S)-binding protein [Chloroflexota bacterium]
MVALIEAILYETQRFRSTGFNALRYLGQVADHCTICHKCQPPCPVNIDTGAVSILEREILSAHRTRKTALATRLALAFLDSRSPVANVLMRSTALWAGSRLQRAGAWVLDRLPGSATSTGARGHGRRLAPMPPIPAGTLFSRLPACGAGQAIVIEPDGRVNRTIFYFPGCGSERLYSRVSRAAIHILITTGMRVVLPPPFLCCGFPARVNAKVVMHRRQAVRNVVILNQIRERFGYWRFDAVGVSCGTCRESLAGMNAAAIFGCPMVDVSRLALENGLAAVIPPGRFYHPPCHDSLDGTGQALLAGLGHPPIVVPHCCGEAGTLALSRPDISAAMCGRKREAFKSVLQEISTAKVVLTNCPACLSGLGRNESMGFTARHLAEELAIGVDGKDWLGKCRSWHERAEVVTF